MAQSSIRQLICVQILFAQLIHLAVPDGTNQDSKNISRITIPRGTHKYNLNCGDENGIIWKRIIGNDPKPKTVKNTQSYLLPLICVRDIHEGIYTCHANKTGPPLRTIVVEVKGTEKGELHTCGKPSRGPFDAKSCESYYVNDYPCCENIPVPAEKMKLDIELSSTNSKTTCDDDYSEGKFRSYPYNVIVNWKASKIGSYKTWGWKIIVLGLDGDANSRKCLRIISKNTELTRPIRNLTMGAKYNITIQTLPESNDKPNAIFDLIQIPSLLDMCETLKGRRCNWEFCIPVVGVTVTNYSTSPIVSWRPSPLYKSKPVFEVFYYDEEKTDEDQFMVENKNYFNLTMLDFKYGHKYFVKVRPIFMHAGDFDQRINGKFSDTLMFYTAVLPPTESNLEKLKIIVSVCVVTFCLFIVFLWIIRRKFQSSKGGNSPSREKLIKPNSDVLLVHDGHCESCNNATHLLANILCETGHIRCFLDLCSTTEIAIHGLKWQEDKFKTCGKIVVICTKDSYNTYYNGNGPSSNFYQKSFRMVLKMILGEMVNDNDNNNATQIFPVCFDYSSSDDIPSFLRDRQFFSLPSGIEQLLLSLSGLNARLIGVPEERGFDDSKLRRMINQWENAIRKVQREHCHHQSGPMINYARSWSCTPNEAARV